VGILGMSYKPDTEVIDESQGLMLAKALVGAGCRVLAYDPAAMENARGVLGDTVVFAPSMEACAGESDVLVIATPWSEFKALQPSHFRAEARTKGRQRPVILDWWRMLRPADFAGVAEYIACGMGPAGAHEEEPRFAATGRVG